MKVRIRLVCISPRYDTHDLLLPEKRAAAQKAEADFFALIKESGIGKPGAVWKEVMSNYAIHASVCILSAGRWYRLSGRFRMIPGMMLSDRPIYEKSYSART